MAECTCDKTRAVVWCPVHRPLSHKPDPRDAELAHLRAALETHRTCIAENVAEMERAAEEITQLRAALAKAEAARDKAEHDTGRAFAERDEARRQLAEADRVIEILRGKPLALRGGR